MMYISNYRGLSGLAYDSATAPGGIGLKEYYRRLVEDGSQLTPQQLVYEVDTYGITLDDLVAAYASYGQNFSKEDFAEAYRAGGGRNPDILKFDFRITTVPSWFNATLFSRLDVLGKADEFNKLIRAGYSGPEIKEAAEAAFGPQSDEDWNQLLFFAAARRGSAGLFVEEAQEVLDQQEEERRREAEEAAAAAAAAEAARQAAAAAEAARLEDERRRAEAAAAAAALDEQRRQAEAAAAAAAAAQAEALAAMEQARTQAEAAAAASAKAKADAERAQAEAIARAAAEAAARAAAEAGLPAKPPGTPLPALIQPQQATGGNTGLLIAAGLAALTLLG